MPPKKRTVLGELSANIQPAPKKQRKLTVQPSDLPSPPEYEVTLQALEHDSEALLPSSATSPYSIFLYFSRRKYGRLYTLMRMPTQGVKGRNKQELGKFWKTISIREVKNFF